MRRANVVRPSDEGDVPSSAGRVPAGLERWRQSLRRSRRAVGEALRLVEASERLADDAERLIQRRLRPIQARGHILGAYGRLAQAARRVCQSYRNLAESRDRVVAAPEEAAAAPLLLVEGAIDCGLVLQLVAAVAERVMAIDQEYDNVTVTIAGGGVLAAQQRKRIPAHRGPFAVVPHDREQQSDTPSSACAEGARQVCKGRAPPFF